MCGFYRLPGESTLEEDKEEKKDKKKKKPEGEEGGEDGVSNVTHISTLHAGNFCMHLCRLDLKKPRTAAH